MVWRDLDIYLQVDDLRAMNFFELGSKINTLFNPLKMSFRNELIGQSRGMIRNIGGLIAAAIYTNPSSKGASQISKV